MIKRKLIKSVVWTLMLTAFVGLVALPSGSRSAPPPTTDQEVETAVEEETESPNILQPEAPLAIWSLVVFLVLFAVLTKFAWKPLMKALSERESYYEKLLADAESARAESARTLAEHQKRIEAAGEEIHGMIDQGRRDAQASADAIVRKAQEEAEAARKHAQNEIANARDQALMEIWSRTADLAVTVAGKVLARNVGEEDHRRLISAAIEAIPSVQTSATVMPNGQGSHA